MKFYTTTCIISYLMSYRALGSVCATTPTRQQNIISFHLRDDYGGRGRVGEGASWRARVRENRKRQVVVAAPDQMVPRVGWRIYTTTCWPWSFSRVFKRRRVYTADVPRGRSTRSRSRACAVPTTRGRRIAVWCSSQKQCTGVVWCVAKISWHVQKTTYFPFDAITLSFSYFLLPIAWI